MLDEINNNLVVPAQESSDPEARWMPDCQLGECHVPDFSGQSYLEYQTLDNVAKFADIEVSFIKRPTRSCCSDFLNIFFLLRFGSYQDLAMECCSTTEDRAPAVETS